MPQGKEMYGSTNIAILLSRKYSPLASSVRVIYGLCCYTAPDIQAIL
jgi:hypothetical protein